MPINSHPVLAELPPPTPLHIAAGEVLFYQGDAVNKIYWLENGDVEIFRNGVLQEQPNPPFLDELAVLGDLPHQVKCVAKSDCQFATWEPHDFWKYPKISQVTRAYLAQQIQHISQISQMLSAPISYQYGETEVGAFLFDNVTMIFAFCEADKTQIEALLPPHLAILQRPKRETAPLLVVLADFPRAYRESGAGKAFAYTETTYFVPVRYQTALGFFVPHIYPSAYEPILLGRDIYGFPKELGFTELAHKRASLSVNGQNRFDLGWSKAIGRDESALVAALGNWLGLGGFLTGVAFQAGELLRKTARLPATRRVDVYNHKKLLAADGSQWAVNQLTRATFGVLRWYQVTELADLTLDATQWNLSIQAAYRTQLDLRLSTGRVVEDYLIK